MVKLINNILILNVHRDYTFFINGNLVTLYTGNYSLNELITFFSNYNFVYNYNTRKIGADFITLKFYTQLDKLFILNLLGFNNYLLFSDLSIIIKGSALYSINTLINSIVKLNLYNNNNLVLTSYISTGGFSETNQLEFFVSANSFKLFNQYTNEELNTLSLVNLVQ
jgi:hypothetical protein